MHFFRIKIKRHRAQPRSAVVNEDQEQDPARPERNLQQPHTRRFRDSIMQFFPFVNQVSNVRISIPRDETS